MGDFHGVWRTAILSFPDGNGAFQAELRFLDGTAENIHHEFASAGGDRPQIDVVPRFDLHVEKR